MAEAPLQLRERLDDEATSLDGLTIDAETAQRELTFQLYPESARLLTGRWVICYLRISDDQDEDRRGVRTQAIDTIIHAFASGAAGVIVAEENDTGAYKNTRITMTSPEGDEYFIWRVIRPVWQTSLSRLRKGVDATGMVVYNLDRLARDPRDLEDAIELTQYAGRPILGATGTLDLSTDNGRTMARVLVAMANQSSADTSRRVSRAHRRRRESGKPAGGFRAYGWMQDKLTNHPAEKAELRAAREKLIAGVPLSAIIADWNARGITTPRSNAWQYSALLSTLRNPRLAGLMPLVVVDYRDNGAKYQYWDIAKRADGTEIKGTWDAIFERKEWDELIEVIGARVSPDAEYQATARAIKYLLAGILRCGGKCGRQTRMTGEIQVKPNGNQLPYYRCQSRGNGGCGMGGGRMERVDELITRYAFGRHDAKKGELPSTRVEDPNAEVEGQLALIEKQLSELHAEWKAGNVPTSAYLSLRAERESEEKLLKRQKKQTVQRAKAPVLQSVRDRWETASLVEQNAFIGQYVQAVIVHPLAPGQRGWTPERYEPVPVED